MTKRQAFLCTLLGVVIITPDALLLRLIQADPWTIMFWRGLGFFAVQALIVIAIHRRSTLAVCRAVGLPGLLIGVNMAIGQILFVFSIHQTDAANTLVIIAAIPLATAFVARFWLGEAIARRNVVAGILALFAVGLTMSGGVARGGTSGDVAAIGVVICLAILFAGIRRLRDRDILPGIAFSGLVSAGLAVFAAPALLPSAADIPLLLVLCLAVSPLSFALISVGPRHLPAPEVGLLLLLETVLGPLWVWLALAEAPSPQTLIGGGIMLATLTVNSWLLLRHGR